MIQFEVKSLCYYPGVSITWATIVLFAFISQILSAAEAKVCVRRIRCELILLAFVAAVVCVILSEQLQLIRVQMSNRCVGVQLSIINLTWGLTFCSVYGTWTNWQVSIFKHFVNEAELGRGWGWNMNMIRNQFVCVYVCVFEQSLVGVWALSPSLSRHVWPSLSRVFIHNLMLRLIHTHIV